MNSSSAHHGGYRKNVSLLSVHELHPPTRSVQERRLSGNAAARVDSSCLVEKHSNVGTKDKTPAKRYVSTCDVNESSDSNRKKSVLKLLVARTKSAFDPSVMSGWYSLSGYLQLKFLGGGFTALLRSKRRYYFVLDEINCQLAYYKDYDDFARKKHPTGNIELKNSAVTLNETKPRIFTLHTIGGRQYELEAESEESALVWLECLQKRSIHKRDVLHNGYPDPYGQENAPSSLPSETQLAEALETALQSCTQSIASGSANPQPTRPCAFYFGSRPESVTTSSSTGHPDFRSPPGSPLEDRPDRVLDLNDPARPNGSSHFWINQWLRKQEFDMCSKESVIFSCTPTDCRHAITPATPSSGVSDSIEGSYGRFEENVDIGELKKELDQYKVTDQNQKRQIEELVGQMKKLTQQLQHSDEHSLDQPDNKVRYFQSQNKFLNAEVVRLSSILKAESEEKAQLTSTMIDLQKSLDGFKSDYAFLLQSCLRIYVGDKRNDCAELKLFGFERHQEHILRLLAEARKLDPSLPTWEGLLPNGTGYVDAYGFRTSFADVGLALHFAATQLLTFYRSASDQEKRQRWKEYLQRTKSGLANTKEARALARAGIPARYRSAIWRCLVHQKVADLKQKYGKYYFRGLCNWQASASDVQGACTHQKQITLDLMRTMPQNVHFSAPPQKGIIQLQAVLQAICAHNPRIGYCQGMNFVTAICLLFLNPEDSFWFLVALTERYFVPNYFDHSLTGAQADQEVLKDILEEKLPDLAKHFMKRDIELATVTLNWFLALFYDSLPFETLLRIWDCFLLEGPKVLFRFVLAILYMHRNTLLDCSDTMSILKALKLCAKHTYDVDALVKIAFETLKPFPRRQELIRRQTRYMEILKIRFQRKEELKAAALANNTFDDVLYQIELVVCLTDSEILVAYCCHNGKRKLCLVSCHTGKTLDLPYEFDWSAVAATTDTSCSIVFLSLLSGDIVSLSIDPAEKSSTIRWEKRLPDAVLQLLYYEDDRLFAAMANGTLAVFENASEQSEPGTLQLYFIPIGAAPLSCLCLVEEETQIWSGMGGRLVVLNAKTLDCLERLTIANSSVGCISAVFDRLLTLQMTDFGVWMSAFNSSVIQLWDPNTLTCKLVFDTSGDHRSLHMNTDSRITCMLAFDACIWVGMADGYILVYDVVPRNTSPRLPDRKMTKLTIDHAPPIMTHSSPSLVKKAPSQGKNELAHRDSGYSGTNSSYCASTEMLQYASNDATTSGIQGPAGRPHRRVGSVRSNPCDAKKRWQSCHDLSPESGIAPPLDEQPLHDYSPAKLRIYPRRQRSSPNGSRKYSIQARKKHSLETRRSLSSLATSSGTGLEYDDLFVPYPDPDYQTAVGGLLSGSRTKSQSDWSLSVATAAAVSLSNAQSPSVTEGTFSFSESVTEVWSSNANVDGRMKKSRRQLLKRPTRQELKRKDLDVDEYLPMLQRTKRKTGAAVSPKSPVRKSLILPQVVTEADTDNESQKSNGIDASETASVLSMASSGVVEPPYPYRLQCIMRLKISDKPVRCLALSKTIDGKQCAISCAGGFDESEAILVWTKDANDQKLWIPKPVVPSEKRSKPKQSLPTAQIKAQLQRRSTTPWFR